jgi:hypothetical protein
MLMVVAVLSAALCGCGRSEPSSALDAQQRQLIVGKWASSTSPELAATAVSMEFRESGEVQLSQPLRMNGKSVTAEIDGMQQPLRFDASGRWKLTGGRLEFEITATNLTDFRSRPIVYTVAELSDKLLVLEHASERTTLFHSAGKPADD